jgi:hypothetical protein
MSKYTVRGSAELDARIDSDLASITDHAWPFCLAGVLLGGYGRGEGTPFIQPDGSQLPFNDYDLVVVVEKLDDQVRKKFRALEVQLTDALGLPVDLCPYAAADLPKCEFSLLNYEMKHGHMVVWGDESVLDAMPAYPHEKIPLSEGTRLLLNRGKLLLDIKQRLASSAVLTGEERIRFIKFIHKVLLAFGDCALLAAGQYHLSYSVKKERLPGIGNCPGRDAVVDGYLKAIELKEWGDFQALENYDVEAEFDRVCALFLIFLPWYRTQYSGRECSIPKAMALNLQWNGRSLPWHPRHYLYEALPELLAETPNVRKLKKTLFCNRRFPERFYALQRRFS